MNVKELKTSDVDMLRGVLVRQKNWHEGVALVGYWPAGRSFIFEHNGEYFCMTDDFVDELVLGDVGKKIMHMKPQLREHTIDIDQAPIKADTDLKEYLKTFAKGGEK